MSEDRALTIRQPWAALIMAGVKDVENRSWPVPSTLPQWRKCGFCPTRVLPTNDQCCVAEYLGGGGGDNRSLRDDGPFPFRLWIHAGKTYDDAAYLRWYHDPGWSHSALPSPMPPSHPTREYPRGVLLGSVLVTGCHHANDCGRHPGCTCPMTGDHPSWHYDDCAAHDNDVRWYCSPWAEPDAYHWTLTNPQLLPEPIPMKGRQGLWRVPHDAGGFLVGSSSPSTPSTTTD